MSTQKSAEEWMAYSQDLKNWVTPLKDTRFDKSFIEQIQSDARRAAFDECAEIVDKLNASKDNKDTWSITRTVAFHDAKTAILATRDKGTP